MALIEQGRPWRRIALLRPGRIGDYLCATPAIRALHHAVPEAELDLVALPQVRDLAARNPSLTRFVAFPGFPGIAEQLFTAAGALRWLARMQQRRYDLVLQLYGSGVHANPVALLMGGRRTAGFIRPGDSPGLLDAALPLPVGGHEVDRVLALVTHIGGAPAGRGYQLALRPNDRRAATAALAGLGRPLVGLHLGARDPRRCLAPQAAEQVALALHHRHRGGVVVLGGRQERPAADRFVSRLTRAGVPARSLAGRSLASAAAGIAALDVLVTTDSGPAHIGYATTTPSVTLFLDSDPRRWAAPEPGPHVVLDVRAGLDLPSLLAAASSVLASPAVRR